MKNSYPFNITRACGHLEVVSLRYGSAREKNIELSAANAMFCKECRGLLESWMGPTNSIDEHAVVLASITGTPRQVSWAQALRSKLAAPMLRAMNSAAEHGGPVGAAAWKALYVTVTQREASFWIDNRERGINHYMIEREAGCFARGYDSLALGSTIFTHIRKSGAHRLAEIEQRCPVSAEAHQVAS